MVLCISSARLLGCNCATDEERQALQAKDALALLQLVLDLVCMAVMQGLNPSRYPELWALRHAGEGEQEFGALPPQALLARWARHHLQQQLSEQQQQQQRQLSHQKQQGQASQQISREQQQQQSPQRLSQAQQPPLPHQSPHQAQSARVQQQQQALGDSSAPGAGTDLVLPLPPDVLLPLLRRLAEWRQQQQQQGYEEERQEGCQEGQGHPHPQPQLQPPQTQTQQPEQEHVQGQEVHTAAGSTPACTPDQATAIIAACRLLGVSLPLTEAHVLAGSPKLATLLLAGAMHACRGIEPPTSSGIPAPKRAGRNDRTHSASRGKAAGSAAAGDADEAAAAAGSSLAERSSSHGGDGGGGGAPAGADGSKQVWAGDEGDALVDTHEERLLRTWLNSLSPGIKVASLFDANMRTGYPLLLAAEAIHPGCVQWSRAFAPPFKSKVPHKLMCVENGNQAVAICTRAWGLPLVNIGGVDIAEGRRMAILSLVWQMMRHHMATLLRLVVGATTGGSAGGAGGSSGVGARSAGGGGGPAVCPEPPVASPTARVQRQRQQQIEEVVLRWANERLAAGGSGLRISGFADPKLAEGQVLLELLRAISPRSVTALHVLPGADEGERESNARYVLSVARKLGAAVFLTPEDITAGKPKLMLVLLASFMSMDLGSGGGGSSSGATDCGSSTQ